MSFSYENFYLSGFNSGATDNISGIQKQTPLYWIITGLKYNGSLITTADFSWFTGTIIAGSGTLTEQSGFIGYDSENDDYRGVLAFDVASGFTATGCLELYWNSGTIYQQGVVLTKGFETFSNANEDAWNIITNTNDSVDNADSQHSHSSTPQNLYDLDDVNIPGTINDGDALIYESTSGGWTTGVSTSLDPTGYETVSGSYITHIVTSNAHHEPSGYETVSGLYKTHIITSNAHHDPSGYETISGAYLTHVADPTAHHDPTGYETISGAWISWNKTINTLTGGAWKVWYSQGDGYVQELTLGTSGYALFSNGATSAPVFASIPAGADNLGNHSGTMDLTMGNYDIERVGTVFSNDTSRYMIQVTSDGSDAGTLYDIGVYWNTADNDLSLRGYSSVGLAVQTTQTLKAWATSTYLYTNLLVSGATKAEGVFYRSATDPTNINRLNYDGYFYATRVYNAVYNDYADYWICEKGVSKIPGYCYSLGKKGLHVTNKRADKACMGICTDTYGHAVGNIKQGIPISVGGFLLAYCDREYEAGDLLVPNEKGILTLATKEEILMQRCVAKYMYKETKKKTKGVWVRNRHWVKVL